MNENEKFKSPPYDAIKTYTRAIQLLTENIKSAAGVSSSEAQIKRLLENVAAGITDRGSMIDQLVSTGSTREVIETKIPSDISGRLAALKDSADAQAMGTQREE